MFYRAETIQWDQLLETGGWAKFKEEGKIDGGKDYIVQDGDVMELDFYDQKTKFIKSNNYPITTDTAMATEDYNNRTDVSNRNLIGNLGDIQKEESENCEKSNLLRIFAGLENSQPFRITPRPDSKFSMSIPKRKATKYQPHMTGLRVALVTDAGMPGIALQAILNKERY